MLEGSNTLVLEIIKQGDSLIMSIFERKEFSSTIKHYSQITIPVTQINSSCQEIASILNKAGKRDNSGIDLLAELKKTGLFLWDHLLSNPIKQNLCATKIQKLVLSLDEELINIPWELLYDGSQFFCLKFNLGRVVRTKDQPQSVSYRNTDNPLRMLILANPTADLKSAYQEGIYIRKQFDRKRKQIKIDFKSTPITTLYVKNNLRDYDIVHFAGHSENDAENPKNTGWSLSDGSFTTQDIIALSQSRPLPSLVFSNACYSANTTGNFMDINYQEKTYSLAAAFLFSGVRHYIGTIWRIEDPISLVFAKEFYNYLIKGFSIGECIRLARLRLIEEGGIHWASYILYGDPNFSLFQLISFHSSFQLPEPGIRLETKIRGIVSKYKNVIAKSSLAVFTIFICICTYSFLPVRNPNAYVLFLKSNKLYQKGRNYKSIAISKEIIKKDTLFLAAYPLLANTYERIGERDKSLKCYFEYAFYSQKKHDNKNLVSAYIGLGWTYQLLGEYPKALEFYNKAISLSEETKDKLHQATVLRKLALWHIDKEDYNKALELLMKSSAINQERAHIYEHKYNLACDYFDIGLVFCDKDDFTAAKEFYRKSLLLFEEMKLKNELSDYYFNLGELCLFDKHYELALDCYLKGLRIDQKQGNMPSIAGDYNMIGELYMEMGNVIKAEDFFKKSELICKDIKAEPELAAVYYNLGILYKQEKNKDKANEFLRQAQDIYREIDTPVYQRISDEINNYASILKADN